MGFELSRIVAHEQVHPAHGVHKLLPRILLRGCCALAELALHFYPAPMRAEREDVPATLLAEAQVGAVLRLHRAGIVAYYVALPEDE